MSKPSKKKSKRHKQSKSPSERDNAKSVTYTANTLTSSDIAAPMNDSDDFSDTDDEEFDMKPSYLVNAVDSRVVLSQTSASALRPQLSEDYTIDRSKDTEVLLTGAFYRGDIPKYTTIVNGEVVRSSASLARQAYSLPSGAVTVPSTEQGCFMPIKPRRNHDTIRMNRSERYYLPSSNPLASVNGFTIETLKRGKVQAKGSQLGIGIGFVPVIPFNSPADEISKIGTDSESVTSEAKLYQSEVMELTRQLQAATRPPISITPYDTAIAYLRLVGQQPRLLRLQIIGSGGSHSSSSVASLMLSAEDWCAKNINNTYLIEKQCSLLEDAIRSIQDKFGKGCEELSMLYLYLIRLTSQQGSRDQLESLWTRLFGICPVDIGLYREYLQFITSEIDSSESIGSIRIKTQDAHAKLLGRIRANVTAYFSDMVHACETVNIASLTEAVQLELSAGFTERAVALAQMSIDLALEGNVCSVRELESYWESGYPRIGESVNLHDGLNAWRSDSCPEDGNVYWEACIEAHRNTGTHMSSDTAEIILNLDQVASKISINDNTISEEPEEPSGSIESISEHVENTRSGVEDVSHVDNIINGKRKRAADYFEDHLTEKPLQSSDTLNPSSSTENPSYRLEYSRVHGYRIPVPITRNEIDPAYKRALNVLKPSSEGDENEENILLHVEKMPTKTLTNDISIRRAFSRYCKEEILGRLQYRPLKLASSSDSDSALSQPHRAVLFDDIKPWIDNTKYTQDSSRVWLVFGILEVLGIQAPMSESSLSEHRRQASRRCVGSNNICSGDIGLFYSLKELLYFAIPSQFRVYSNENALPIAVLSGRVRSEDAVLAIIGHSNYSTLIANDSLVHDHLLSLALQDTNVNKIDTRLNFMLRLLRSIESRSCISYDIKTSIRRGRVSLLVQRYICEFNQKEKAHVSMSAKQILQEVKSLIQVEESEAADRSGHMGLWCSYLVAEIMIGQRSVAYKVCDKLLVAASAVTKNGLLIMSNTYLPSYLTKQPHLRESCIGGFQLALIAVRLALGLPFVANPKRVEVLGPSRPEVAILIITDFCLGKISNGCYLRDGADVSRSKDSIKEALEALQVAVLSLIEQIAEALKTASNNNQKPFFAQNMLTVEASQPVLSCISLLAWLTALAQDFKSGAEIVGAVCDELLAYLGASSTDSKVLDDIRGAFFKYPKRRTCSSLSELIEASHVKRLCSTPVGAMTLRLLEDLYILRVEIIAFGRDRQGAVSMALEGLYHFPGNAVLIESLWLLEARAPGGYIRTKSYLKSQSARLVSGGGLLPAEILFSVALEIGRAFQSDIQTQAAVSTVYEMPSQLRYDGRKRVLRVVNDLLDSSIGKTVPWLWEIRVGLSHSLEEKRKSLYRGCRRCPVSRQLWLLVWGSGAGVGEAIEEGIEERIHIRSQYDDTAVNNPI